jgi:hypothetical protein
MKRPTSIMKRKVRRFTVLAAVVALALPAPAVAVPSAFARLVARTVDSGGRLSDLVRISLTGRRVPNPGGDQIPVKVQCVEGGTGKRVQAVYAYIEGQPNRYASKVGGILQAIPFIDDRFEKSAQETGGHRSVRWVQLTDCTVAVAQVSISSTAANAGANGLGTLASELASKGFTDVNRKYLIWIDPGDSTIRCGGRGGLAYDDRPGLENANNKGPSYASAPLCIVQGATEPAVAGLAAHELMHSLGAVQNSAPNSTREGHCTDGYDSLCLSSSAPCVELLHVRLFDCGHDDYFYAGSPPAGNYLATHWNTANSSFLINPAWPG